MVYNKVINNKGRSSTLDWHKLLLYNIVCLRFFDHFYEDLVTFVSELNMPKKLSTNTKSVEAKERKAAIKKEQTEAEDKKKEDGTEY